MSRGRAAQSPSDIPKKGLVDVAARIWQRQSSLNLSLVAAGIAFFGLLSLFPAITAGVALAGLVMERETLVQHSQDLAEVLPDAVASIIMGQLREVASADGTLLSFAALFAVGLALYSSSKATGNFMAGLNMINEEEEERGFIVLKAQTLALTLALLVVFILAIAIVAVLPSVAAWVGVTPWITEAIHLVRWPVLFMLGAGGIALLYRYGPDRRAADWRWLTPGALCACALWVGGTYGFSFYVQSFGNYNETFGALGGVIILLTWLWLSSFVVLFGALVDAELEAQTAHDSTVGPDRPRGQRGAVKADELGRLRTEPNA